MFTFKNVFLMCASVLCTAISSISMAATTAPKEIEQFIPPSTKLIDYQTSDLNDDGKDDALIVYENIVSDNNSSTQPRTVLILIRRDND